MEVARRRPLPVRRAAVALLAALAVAAGAAEAVAQPRPPIPSPGLERFRDNSGVIDSPSRGGNIFNNFPAYTVERKDEMPKPAPAEDAAADPSAAGEAADAPLPSRSESVTERILREIELRKAIAKRRQALSRTRSKGAAAEAAAETPPEESSFAEIVGFGDEPEPLMPSAEGGQRGEEERPDSPSRPRSSAWRGRQAPDAAEAPVERGLTGRSAIDASRRPMSGGIRAGAPAARPGWGQPATGDRAAKAGPKPLNAGRPIAPATAGQRAAGADAAAAPGRPSSGRTSTDRPARRPPLFPDRVAP